jgi:hypothetical protein
MPVVLYGDKIVSMTLREEIGLKEVENRIFWTIFVLKADER